MSHRPWIWTKCVIADHDGPGADFPASHQSLGDIGIVSGEVFGDGAIRGAEHEKCPVRRIGLLSYCRTPERRGLFSFLLDERPSAAYSRGRLLVPPHVGRGA